MDLGDIQNILGEHWTKLIAFGTLLYLLYTYIGKPLIGIGSKISAVQANLSESLPVLLEISKQFRPNSGSSLFDIITNIQKDINISKQRHRMIINSLNLAYFESLENGEFSFVSKKWTEMFKMDLNEALGFGWINCVLHSDRERVRREWEAAIKEKRESDIHFKAGDENCFVEVSLHSYVAKNKNGDLVGFVGVIQSK